MISNFLLVSPMLNFSPNTPNILDLGRVYKMYKIPKEVLRNFHHVSARNRLENGKHIETLAFLFGYKSESNFIGTHLIFPEQEGTCSRVDDKGKFFLYII